MRFDVPPTSRELGINSVQIASAYDSAVKDRVITVEEGDRILGAEVRHRQLPDTAIPDLERIANQAGYFFERRHSWVERDLFDTIVDATLRGASPMTYATALELGGTLATIGDPGSLAHVARAIEKLRANSAFGSDGAAALGNRYYEKLQRMDGASADWRGKKGFDHATAVLLGAENLGACEPPALQQLAHAIGQVPNVEALPHVLRAIEKLRANDASGKSVDEALYALLIKLDGPPVITDARKTFVDRLAALQGSGVGGATAQEIAAMVKLYRAHRGDPETTRPPLKSDGKYFHPDIPGRELLQVPLRISGATSATGLYDRGSGMAWLSTTDRHTHTMESIIGPFKVRV